METQSTYLKRLKFDAKLLTSFIARFLGNPRLVILLLISVIVFGVFSYTSLPRNLNPEIKIPIVIVQTTLPGASPKDMESLVTIPIEDSVSSLQRVKTVKSSSQDSLSLVSLEFESGVEPDKARSDVQSAVDTITTLPKDAKAPVVQKLDFENQPIWTFAITGGDNLASLTRLSKQLETKLKELASIDKVITTGLEEQEIQIIIKPEVFASYSINPFSISTAIKSSLVAFPAGSVKTDNVSLSLSIDPQIVTVDDIRALRINVEGNIVRLADIAQVKEISKPDQAVAFLAKPNSKPQRVVNFDVFRSTNTKIDQAASDVKKVLDETIKNYPGFSYASVRSSAGEIDKQFRELSKDFVLTVILVFLVLFVFLGLRQALVSILSAPLTFFISFIVMRITGISLNFISLFSLILALGLLVDDTIVIISAITSYYRTHKFTPLQTGLLVWRDFLTPVFTTTITTVWAFLPMLLSTGILGEFIKPMPIVVSTALSGSFFVAMFITLPLILILLKPQVPFRVRVFLQILVVVLIVGIAMLLLPKNNLLIFEAISLLFFIFVTFLVRGELAKIVRSRLPGYSRRDEPSRFSSIIDRGIIHFEDISSRYKRLIRSILSSRASRIQALLMVITFSFFSYLLFPLGFIKNEFFPKQDQDFMFVSLELPPGTSLAAVQKETLQILNKIKSTPEVDFTTASIGQSFDSNGGIGQGGFNSVLFSMSLHPKRERKISSIKLGTYLRNELADYQKGNISVVESTGGPPAGADLQIKLFGDDLATLDQYSEKVVEFLKKQPGVINVNKTIKPGISKVVFVPDKEKLAQANVSLDSLGFYLRMFASGFVADSVRLADEESKTKDITLRFSSDSEYIEKLGTISIPTSTGNVPLSSLGTFKLEPNPSLIAREDGKRTISVAAGVVSGFNVADQNKKLENFANTELNLSAGYSWKTGGVNEENQKSATSILQAMILSFALILITMVVQFSSFRKATIVMLVIPLSISGVFIIFSLSNTPLSFPALIGILALFGIVVKNSILIVDKITVNSKTGMDFIEAIADGAASRLEPIALTSFATIFGLIPVTLSDPIWRGLGGAIIAGLTFSGTIMLFFIPTVYYFMFAKDLKKN